MVTALLALVCFTVSTASATNSENYPETLRNNAYYHPDSGIVVYDDPIKKDTDTVNKTQSSEQFDTPYTPNPDVRQSDTQVNKKETTSDTDSTIGEIKKTKQLSDTGSNVDQINRNTESSRTKSSDTRIKPTVNRFKQPRGRTTFNVGIQYPGISFAFRQPAVSLEFKLLHESDITVAGSRVYYHGVLLESSNFYLAGDLSLLEFDGDRSSGNGISTGVVGGMETFISDRWSWKLDVGPYYTFVEDESTGVDAQGLDFVVTSSFNIHFY